MKRPDRIVAGLALALACAGCQERDPEMIDNQGEAAPADSRLIREEPLEAPEADVPERGERRDEAPPPPEPR